MKTAIYARYSSDLQSAASIDDQVRICQDAIKRAGLSDPVIYADAAISGTTMERNGIKTLLGAAERREIDVIFSESLDRISRDQVDIAQFYALLQFHRIKLVTLQEGEISEIHVGIKGTMNALYIKELAAKTRRGLEGRVLNGRSAGGPSYGYRKDKTAAEAGALLIVEAEAEVVLRIFREYANGRSPRAIAGDLNRDCFAAPRGNRWNASTINGNRSRGTGILNNELYVGTIVWNRQQFVKNPKTKRRVPLPNEIGRIVRTDVPHLRIVSQ